jgi:hypothetical protein
MMVSVTFSRGARINNRGLRRCSWQSWNFLSLRCTSFQELEGFHHKLLRSSVRCGALLDAAVSPLIAAIHLRCLP